MHNNWTHIDYDDFGMPHRITAMTSPFPVTTQQVACVILKKTSDLYITWNILVCCSAFLCWNDCHRSNSFGEEAALVYVRSWRSSTKSLSGLMLIPRSLSQYTTTVNVGKCVADKKKSPKRHGITPTHEKPTERCASPLAYVYMITVAPHNWPDVSNSMTAASQLGPITQNT